MTTNPLLLIVPLVALIAYLFKIAVPEIKRLADSPNNHTTAPRPYKKTKKLAAKH